MNFSLSWTTARHWLSVAGSVFIGGAAGYVQALLTAGKLTSLPYKQIAIGAVLAGLLAIGHLGQIPGRPSDTNTTEV